MKGFRLQQPLDILDPAACPENFRLVNQLNRIARDSSLAANNSWNAGARWCVLMTNDFTPACDEMIEREGDERLLKNRDERLRQIVRQRTQPRAQSRAENKGLSDHGLL